MSLDTHEHIIVNNDSIWCLILPSFYICLCSLISSPLVLLYIESRLEFFILISLTYCVIFDGLLRLKSLEIGSIGCLWKVLE